MTFDPEDLFRKYREKKVQKVEPEKQDEIPSEEDKIVDWKENLNKFGNIKIKYSCERTRE